MMVSVNIHEITSTLISSMAGSSSNNDLNLTTASHRQSDTHDDPAEETLTTHTEGFQCPPCGKLFSRKYSLKRHLSQFRHCRERYSPKADFDIHVKEYKCPLCEKVFTRKDHLKRHTEPVQQKPHRCRHCCEKFPTQADLDVHITMHNQNCPYCSKVFTMRKELVEHLLVTHNNQDLSELVQETSEKSFQCSLCGKVLSGKYSLKRHLSQFPHCRERYSQEADFDLIDVIKYKCPLCEKVLSRKDGLKTHIDSVHHRPHRCQYCNERFSTEADLNIHITVHNQKCPYCSEVFIMRDELLEHLLLIHDDQDLSELVRDECDGSTTGENSCSFTQTELDAMKSKLEDKVNTTPTCNKKSTYRRLAQTCWICQKTLHSGIALERHIQAHTGEKTFPCDHCDRLFANEKEQQGHLRFLNLERSFKCDQCGKGFKKKCFLDIHLTRHRSEKPFQCPHCPKSYKFKLKLKEHLRVHTGEKPYNCRYCDEAFALLRQRVQHELVKHDVGRKEYKCEHCPETFTSQSQRWIHSKSHTSNVLRCEQCCYVTLLSFKMARHKRTHTNEKPYSGDQCSRRFTQLARLHIHMRSHTGEKPYACDRCDKAFVDSYSLKRHIRTHTGEKPYKCNYCSKSFSQGCQRQFHERTHTGEKPYECSQCEKKFTRRQELNKHLETHKKAKQPPSKKRKVVSENPKMRKERDFNSFTVSQQFNSGRSADSKELLDLNKK